MQSTGDFIACQLLGCGEYDLRIFDTLTDEEYFADAVDELKEQGVEINAGTVWEEAIWTALSDIFGNDADYFDMYFNYIDSHVSIHSSKIDQIENFEEKAEEFAEKTGFEIEY
jgi:hypothetical protein